MAGAGVVVVDVVEAAKHCSRRLNLCGILSCITCVSRSGLVRGLNSICAMITDKYHRNLYDLLQVRFNSPNVRLSFVCPVVSHVSTLHL